MVWVKKFACNIRFSLNIGSPLKSPRPLGEVGVKKKTEANLVLLTGLFRARANARVPTRRAGKHACTGLVHLDAKFRIRRSILGKFRSNFDLEGHTGREFEWYEY